jgi:hypothetical protein
MEAATSGSVFAACLDEVLLPELRHHELGAVPVMDSLLALPLG